MKKGKLTTLFSLTKSLIQNKKELDPSKDFYFEMNLPNIFGTRS